MTPGLSTRIIQSAREGDLETFLRLAEEYGSVEAAQALVRGAGLPTTRITLEPPRVVDRQPEDHTEDEEGEPNDGS
jgi:hypothetical protein